MTTVFISYRRSDSSANAGRLCDWLKRQFKSANVFLDTEKIAPGDKFPQVLDERLAASDVLLAVIGPMWVTITDSEGRRRLDNPEDFVAIEIATALKRGTRIIPVLVGSASMPAATQLPATIRDLCERNAIAIDDSRFDQDFDNLVDAIMGRARGFARRELDRLQRGVRVLKASSLLAPVLALVLLFGAWTQVFDAFLLDTRVASYSMWLGERFSAAPRDSKVVLIAIDEASEKRFNRNYGRTAEWRLDHAKLIDRLVGSGATTIAFDLYIESKIEGNDTGDAALADAIRRATQKQVPIIIGIRSVTAQKPSVLQALTDAGASTGSLCIGTKLGYAFNVPLAVSPDMRGKRLLRALNPALGLVAFVPAQVEAIDEERHDLSFGSGSAQRFVHYSVLDHVDEASTRCPTLGQGHEVASLLLRLSPSGYWRAPERRASYADVLLDDTAAMSNLVKGKIALVGVTLSDSEDTHDAVRGWSTEDVFGVELHADTLGNLERGIAVRPLGPVAQWLLMVVLAGCGAAMSFLLFDRPPLFRRLALGGALVAYACFGVACYLAFDILLNTLYDVTAFAAAYLVLGRLQRKALAASLAEVAS